MDNSQLIDRMRSRAKQLRRMVGLTHDPRIAEILQTVIAEIEADVERLTRESAEGPRH